MLADGSVWFASGLGPMSTRIYEEVRRLPDGLCFVTCGGDEFDLITVGRFHDRRSALLAARRWCEIIVIDDDGNVIDRPDAGEYCEAEYDTVETWRRVIAEIKGMFSDDPAARDDTQTAGD